MTTRTPSYFLFAFLCIVLPISSQIRQKAAKKIIIPDRFTVVLADPAVGTRFATREDLQSPAAAAYRVQIKSRQDALTRNIESRGMHVTGSVTDLLNALFVTAPSGSLSVLQSLPGVAIVRPMRRFKSTLNRATQLMNAPAAWMAVGGQSNAGAGIKIGILDTGIDQTHPAFQDSSLTAPSGFPKCTTGYQADCAYTTNKVIVARSYVRQLALDYVVDPTNPAPQSDPDDYSPRDRDGHGTSTASCAAGYTNTGTALSTTGGPITFNGMATQSLLG